MEGRKAGVQSASPSSSPTRPAGGARPPLLNTGIGRGDPSGASGDLDSNPFLQRSSPKRGREEATAGGSGDADTNPFLQRGPGKGLREDPTPGPAVGDPDSNPFLQCGAAGKVASNPFLQVFLPTTHQSPACWWMALPAKAHVVSGHDCSWVFVSPCFS